MLGTASEIRTRHCNSEKLAPARSPKSQYKAYRPGLGRLRLESGEDDQLEVYDAEPPPMLLVFAKTFHEKRVAFLDTEVTSKFSSILLSELPTISEFP